MRNVQKVPVNRTELINNKKWQEDFINNYWLGLGDTSQIKTTNPFSVRTEFDLENPHVFLLDLMRRPENFAFTCKHLLNIQLHPFQVAILRELWLRPFPMLIGTRGLGKSWLLALYAMLRATFCQGSKVVIVGAAFRQAKCVFDYCQAIWENAPVLIDLAGNLSKNGPRRDIDKCTLRIGESVITALPLGDGCLSTFTAVTYGDRIGRISDLHTSATPPQMTTPNRQVWGDGQLRTTDEAYFNGLRPTKKILTAKGLGIEGTHNHKLKVIRNMEIVWCRMDEMKVGDYLLVDRSERWFDPKLVISEEEAYSVGLMVGDGCWTQKYREDWLYRWELENTYAKDKCIPPPLLRANKNAMAAFIRGVFDTDGNMQAPAEGGDSKVGISVTLTNTSETLIDQIQYVLLHFGIISTKTYRWNRVYELLITGKDVVLFHERIGFGLKRKLESLDVAIAAKIRNSTITDHVPGVKEEADPNIYYDKIKSIEDSECETYDIHVPSNHTYCANGFVSHNSKIRGHRANYIISDEFASIPVAIFETVVRGFAAVSSSPVLNLQHESRIEAMIELGMQIEEDDKRGLTGNQTVISGTAYYSFNHFYSYWKRYKGIVESQGDVRRLSEIFEGKIPDDFNWKDYCVIRIPYKMIPKGFMDIKQIAQAQATMDKGSFGIEYSATFSIDSDGFFKRTLIEKCVVGKSSNPITKGCGLVEFSAVLSGDQQKTYVMAVDPASENDNLSIIVLEIWPDHRRIVHCWTTNRKRYKEQVKRGLTKENEYYHYAAKRIRELHRLFPCETIAIDSQGGGYPILEALQNKDLCISGERVMYEKIDEAKERDTDGMEGEHIIELINFSDGTWTQKANFGLRKDLEDMVLLFPEFDSVAIGLAIEEDKDLGRVKVDQKDMNAEKIYDTLEDCIMEIEELKDELATIIHSQVGTTMRDRWDVPEVKLPGMKKGRLRKDRYSSLVMANMVARTIFLTPNHQEYEHLGGVARKTPKGQGEKGPMFYGAGAVTLFVDDNMRNYVNSGNYGAVVRRK